MNSLQSFSEDGLGQAAEMVINQLRAEPQVCALLQGFEKVTGFRLQLLRREPPSIADLAESARDQHAFCHRFLNASDKARMHCVRVHTTLRAAVLKNNEPTWIRCAADLLHAASAISMHGEVVGFLAAFGIAADTTSDANTHSALLEMLSEEYQPTGDQAALLQLLETTPRHPDDRLEGAAHLMKAMAAWIQSHAAKTILKKERILPSRLFRICAYVRQHHADATLTSVRVAKEAGVTPQRLAQLFRSGMKMTFTEWLARYRVSKAMEQLSNSKKQISYIALASGFGTLSSFNRAFLKFAGITPSEYRERALLK